MSRSRQAYRLAAHLSEVTSVRVELVYDTGAVWHMNWTDGPLREQMRALLGEALAEHRFAEMRDRTITTHRGTSPRAWAARAIASRREGTFAPAVTEGAAWRRTLPPTSLFGGSDLTPEDFALLQHVEDLIEATPYPERASAPEDEPLIAQLLAAAGGRSASEYKMTTILLNADRAPAVPGRPELKAVPADPAEPGRPALRQIRPTADSRSNEPAAPTPAELRALKGEADALQQRIQDAYQRLWSWTSEESRRLAGPLEEAAASVRRASDTLEKTATALTRTRASPQE